MQFSDDVEHILTYLENTSSYGLMKRDDVGMLLELGAGHGIAEQFNELIFRATHFYNLYSLLRKSSTGAEGYETLEREFTVALGTIRGLLEQTVILSTDQVFLERCQVQYFAPTQGSLRNLVDLSQDLSLLKRVQNEMKHNN